MRVKLDAVMNDTAVSIAGRSASGTTRSVVGVRRDRVRARQNRALRRSAFDISSLNITKTVNKTIRLIRTVFSGYFIKKHYVEFPRIIRPNVVCPRLTDDYCIKQKWARVRLDGRGSFWKLLRWGSKPLLWADGGGVITFFDHFFSFFEIFIILSPQFEIFMGYPHRKPYQIFMMGDQFKDTSHHTPCAHLWYKEFE